MSKADEKLIKRAAISELERLALLLDTELGVTASMSIEEIEDELRGMGLDPNQPLKKTQAHAYVSDEPLHNECSDEVKLLILEIRHLAHQRRYKEALDLAIMATQVDPNYWRAWISRGTLLVLFGEVDAGNKIFERVSKEFSGNPKAVAAGLHGRAWVKEVRGGLDLSADTLQEVAGLYEEALRLDISRTNTRASLLISSLMSAKTDDKVKLLEDSVLREGFFDALRFEFTERGARARKAMQALPAWLRRLLFPIRPILGF
jgi:tetratricopeptide (TPR) repeat protein